MTDSILKCCACHTDKLGLCEDCCECETPSRHAEGYREGIERAIKIVLETPETISHYGIVNALRHAQEDK